jgi:hypothetical protein
MFRTRARAVAKATAAATVVAGTVLAVGAGLASAAIGTTTSVTASPSTISYGQSITLTATVGTVGTSSPFTTGDTVTFSGPGSAFPHKVAISTTCLGLTSCQFVYVTPTYSSGGLPAGSDAVTASYSGNLLANSSSGSTSVTVTSTTPGAPTLTVTAGSEEDTLHWTAPANNGGATITGYNVYRSTTSGGESLLVAGLPASASTYEDTAVVSATYFYTVAATNTVGTGSQSNEASGTPTFPAGTIITCTTGQTCSLDQVGADSSGSDTNVQVTSGSTSSQTVSNALSSSGISCGTTPTISGLFSSFNDTATDHGKTVAYTLYGSEATAANQTYTSRSPLCLGLGNEFSGWFLQGSTWVYGPVPFNNADGLYEGMVPTCSYSGLTAGQPCASFSTGFVDHDGESPSGSGNENTSSGSKKNIFFWTATVTLPPGDGRIGP